MLHELKQHFVDWLLYRQTVKELSFADDHMLADVGIKRSEIKRRARKSAFHG